MSDSDVTHFTNWSDCVDFLLKNPTRRATEPIARAKGTTYGYREALAALGYDRAHERGLGEDYKRLVLA